MSAPTAVEAELARRRQHPLRWLLRLLGLALLLGLVVLVLAVLRLIGAATPHYDAEDAHFRFGSIGAETSSGIPERVWHALPVLFPEDFGESGDYSQFGFLYDTARPELPIGIGQRQRLGVDLVWFNCAVCHTGSYRLAEDDVPVIVSGMPANRLDLGAFTGFILDAADDPRLAPGPLMDAMAENGDRLGPIDRLIWRVAVFPQLREGLIDQAARLEPLLARQPDWGLGRVDTFNPYKVLAFDMDARDLDEAEVVGASDFPSIFLQGPREGMELHWDGNNSSLAERNLSAALGAGVTPDTVDHRSIERIAAWLSDLPPPPSPHRPDPTAIARGQAIYMRFCADCHGYQDASSYVFEGSQLGRVAPLTEIGTDPARLDSYTLAFNQRQLTELFAGTRYAFRAFRKTDGYANAPLDGLWLRAPYLHNGSVPTLAALLRPPDERPPTFLRQSNVIDADNGGFVAPPCMPGQSHCFDTSLPGNSNSGHVYGTSLNASDRDHLLAYLLTF
ncbi:MAG: hypothetical protein AAF689_05760 [Pseudomonadota bacterium]